MAQPNSPINTATPEAFAARSFNFNGFGNTGVLMAKGFVEAQGGTIEAQNRSDRSGAMVRLRFPVEAA